MPNFRFRCNFCRTKIELSSDDYSIGSRYVCSGCGTSYVLSEAELCIPKQKKESFNLFYILFAKGRIGRGRYFLNYILPSIIVAPLIIMKPTKTQGMMIAIIVSVFAVLIFIRDTIRRFHDLEKPGTYIFWLLIPFVNIYFYILLYCVRGTIGENEYGPDPLLK